MEIHLLSVTGLRPRKDGNSTIYTRYLTKDNKNDKILTVYKPAAKQAFCISKKIFEKI